MAATCELLVRDQPCDILAVGRCAECQRAFCASHGERIGNESWVATGDRCVECVAAKAVRQRTWENDRQARQRGYAAYLLGGVIPYLEASPLPLVEVVERSRRRTQKTFNNRVEPVGQSIVGMLAWKRKQAAWLRTAGPEFELVPLRAWDLGTFKTSTVVTAPLAGSGVRTVEGSAHYLYGFRTGSGGGIVQVIGRATDGRMLVEPGGGGLDGQAWAQRLRDLVGPTDWETIYAMGESAG